VNYVDPLGLNPAHLLAYALTLSSRTDLTDIKKLALMMNFAKSDNNNICGAINDLADVLTGGIPTIREKSPYYIGYKAFGATGFKKEYADSGNQVRHFVGSLVTGYYRGFTIGVSMVYANEYRGNQPLSGSDVNLGVEGVDMGANINKIKNWGETIQQRLAAP